MEVILGNEFLSCKELDKSAAVLILFTSIRYPPHEDFICQLVKVYREVNCNRKVFEVINVSVDETSAEFEASVKSMDWLVIPFEKQRRLKRIIEFYEIIYVPALILIDNSGQVVLKNCREDLERLGSNAVDFWLTFLNKTLESALLRGY